MYFIPQDPGCVDRKGMRAGRKKENKEVRLTRGLKGHTQAHTHAHTKRRERKERVREKKGTTTPTHPGPIGGSMGGDGFLGRAEN
jgi:hypothetical protein